jgi:hypothetical protein
MQELVARSQGEETVEKLEISQLVSERHQEIALSTFLPTATH